MGPCEDPSTHLENQAKGRFPQQNKRACRPRSRACLLKGCGRGALLQRALRQGGCAVEGVESAATISANCQRKAGSSCSKPQIQGAAQGTKETKARCSKRCEGHHKKYFFVLLRSPWVIRGIPTQPAVAAAALLFLRMSPVSGTGFGPREALVGTPPPPAMRFH